MMHGVRDAGPSRAAALLPAGLQRVGILARAPALVRELGGDPGRAIEASGLDPATLAAPDATIGFRDAGRFLEACVAETACPAFGLLLGLKGSLDDLGMLGQLMRRAPSVAQALADLTMHQVRHTSRAVTYLLKSSGDAYLGYAIYEPDMPGGRQAQMTAIGFGCRILADLAGTVPSTVYFSFAAGDGEETRLVRRSLPAPVEFDAPFSALALPHAALARPLPDGDVAERQALSHRLRDVWLASQPDLAHLVMRLVIPGVTWGKASLDQVAAELALHPRTLERRLRQDGFRYAEIRDLARFEAARQLLRSTRMTVAQVSATLGYADPSGFNHAFRRWAGVSPTRWRLARKGAVLGRSG